MPLLIEHKQMITEAVNHWLDGSPSRTGSKLAANAGVSSAYLSKIKNGEFETISNGNTATISDAIFNRIANALGVRFDGQMHWDFLTSFRITQRACRKAQKKAIRIIMDGWTGQGKTHGLEYYSVTNDNVVYVKCTQNMTAKGLLDAILHKLHVAEIVRGNYAKIEMIRKVMINRRGFLIIIDEVEVVKPGIYAVLKDISDFTQNKCGFMISGMDIITKLQRLAGNNKPGFPQLKRRFFGNQVDVPMVTQKEIIAVCEHEKITIKEVQNILAEYVKDLDMLSQYVADIKEWQQANGRNIKKEEVVQLLNIVI